MTLIENIIESGKTFRVCLTAPRQRLYIELHCMFKKQLQLGI